MMRRTVALLSLILIAGATLAWGPISRRLDAPLRWTPATAVEWSYDGGSLGQWNAIQARNEVQDAFDIWEAVPTSTIAYSRVGQILSPTSGTPIDVTSANFAQVVNANDGQNPVVYDNNLDIIGTFGLPVTLSGFASILRRTDTEIEKVLILLNGDYYNGNPNDLVGEYDVDRFRAVIVHEIGHFSGLSHSSVNHELVAGIGACPLPTPVQVEKMAPFSVDGIMPSIHHDDVMGLSHLYPSATFNTDFSRINGTALSRDGVLPRDGANLVLRPVTADCDALYESAQSFQAGTNPGEFGGRGSYEFPGLTPDADYSLLITTIQDSGVYPYGAATLGGPDDYYNGIDEAHFSPPDDPTVVGAVTAPAAGSTSGGVDMLINNDEGPTSLSVSGADALQAVKLDGMTQLPSELLILDALYNEDFIRVSPTTTQVAWVNRFTPRPNQLPLRLTRIETGFDRDTDVTGRAIRILVYHDSAGTGDMANATLVYTEDTTIPPFGQGEGGFDFFTLASPVSIASGEFYVGFYDLVSDSIQAIASYDPIVAGAGFSALNSTVPGDFTPWLEGNFYIRARVNTTPADESVLLSWGDSCNESTVMDQDYVVYAGSVASLAGVQDHEPLGCTTEGLKSWVLPPDSADRFFIVVPRVSDREGDPGSGSSTPRTPASSCAALMPDSCP